MPTTLESPSATSLHSVQQAFEHWRRSRVQRGATPMELRSQAVSLMTHHRRVHICKALRINDQALKQWASEAGVADHGSIVGHQPEESGATGRFVELPTQQRVPSGDVMSSKPVTTVRIEFPNGAVMSTSQAFTLEQILSAACPVPGPCA